MHAVAGFSAPIPNHEFQKANRQPEQDVLAEALRQDAESPRGRRENEEIHETVRNTARSRGAAVRPGDAVPQGATINLTTWIAAAFGLAMTIQRLKVREFT